MRGFMLSAVVAFVLAAAVPQPAGAATSSGAPMIASSAPVFALALQQPDKTIDINISTPTGGGRWYVNPVWIGIGAVAVLVILLLVVLAARGGGTTIVKE